jgi:hypothetical protein
MNDRLRNSYLTDFTFVQSSYAKFSPNFDALKSKT